MIYFKISSVVAIEISVVDYVFCKMSTRWVIVCVFEVIISRKALAQHVIFPFASKFLILWEVMSDCLLNEYFYLILMRNLLRC